MQAMASEHKMTKMPPRWEGEQSLFLIKWERQGGRVNGGHLSGEVTCQESV
jgi:hypothetical protein